MNKQMSLFDYFPYTKTENPGEWVEEDRLGRELTFEEITNRVGQLIVIDQSTQSHAWYKVVRVEKIVCRDGKRRLVYYDGARQRGLVDEMYFNPDIRFHERAYELAVPYPL